MGQTNRKATFKVGPMNGREALQSGLRLKGYVAPIVVIRRRCMRPSLSAPVGPVGSTPACSNEPNIGRASGARRPRRRSRTSTLRRF